jgi:multisubunit Na+/H+ antiporter MnhG subunit
MNWKIDWNIVTLGRVIGVAIIIVGVVLAALDASASPDYSLGAHYKLRQFLNEAITFVWEGGLVIVAAEIADRFGWGSAVANGIDWNVTGLIKVLGVAIIVVGTIVAFWDVNALNGAHRIKFSQSNRIFLREAIEVFFEGSLVIVLACIADRIGWGRGDEESPEETQPVLTPES